MGKKCRMTLGILGERLENLIDNLFHKERGILPRLEHKFDNHLAHHEQNKSKRGDRLFKIFIVILQISMSAGILYLLAAK